VSRPVLRIAIACMRSVTAQVRAGYLDALCVGKDDFDKFISNSMWIAEDRPRMRSVMDTLCNGTIDMLGLDRIRVPAEYIAATIAFYVHPINWHVACRFGERANVSADLTRGIESAKGCSASQLLALVLELSEVPETTQGHALFRRATEMMLPAMLENDTIEPMKGGESDVRKKR